jgi:hypothetical protein
MQIIVVLILLPVSTVAECRQVQLLHPFAERRQILLLTCEQVCGGGGGGALTELVRG